MPASEDYTPLDTLKRYLSAPRRMVDEGLSSLASLPQRAFQASEQMRTEGPYNPAPAVEAALTTMGTGAMAGVKAAPGEAVLGAGPIRAYHSSPHDFDKFDLAKIGSGEGAQVYGHGLYFAENPAVSGQGGQYWNDFQRRFSGPEYQASERLRGAGFDREKAIENVNDRINRAINSGDTNKQFMDEQIKTLQLLESGKPVGPRTYEVNINADPAHMLDWDTKIGQQPKAIQDYFRKQIEQFGPEASMEAQYKIARSRAKGSGVELSAGMSEAGIPGIKYLDEGSRGASPYNIIPTGQGNYIVRGKRYSDIADAQQAKAAADAAYETERTRNYVVFNPSILDIVKKYGLAGLASAPALTSGFRDRENQP